MKRMKDYISQRMETAILDEIYEKTTTRFSVTVDNTLNFRLEYLAKILGETRAGLSSEFLAMAVSEAEKELGISITEKDSEYGKAYREFADKNGRIILDPDF